MQTVLVNILDLYSIILDLLTTILDLLIVPS